MTLKRNAKIFLNYINDNTYSVTDKYGRTLLTPEDDYFIYFKNVNFKSCGVIEGRYLGNADNNLIDDNCKSVVYKDNTFAVEKVIQHEKQKEDMYFYNPVKTARMVAVNNKSKTLIILEG